MTARNIHQRLHAVMTKVDYVQKDKKPGMNYSIVSHDVVTAKVRPALVEEGVVYYPVSLTRRQDGNRTEIDLTIRFANIDNPADHIDVVSCGYGVDPQDKGPGKAISYAVKYALLKALGLETGDEPEETQDNSANHIPSWVLTYRDAMKLATETANTTHELSVLMDQQKKKINEVGQIDNATKNTIVGYFSARKTELFEAEKPAIGSKQPANGRAETNYAQG